MSSVLIIDFNDSFTNNIASELFALNILSRVVSYQDDLSLRPSEKAVIWGPGPGHPKDYQNLLPKISNYFNSSQIFQMGICLGHQLFFYFSGYQVIPSKKQMHGQSVPICIPNWPSIFEKSFLKEKTNVQRYNSLAVCNDGIKKSHLVLSRKMLGHYSLNQELFMSYGPNWISYQFHPESVGTDKRSAFFWPLKKFLNAVE